MFAGIKEAINSIHCFLFGHKLLNRSVMAYSIGSEYMYAVIRIHRISKCARCGEIICEEIDSYDKLGWYSSYLAEEEEKALRKRGILSIAEAYQKIEKEG